MIGLCLMLQLAVDLSLLIISQLYLFFTLLVNNKFSLIMYLFTSVDPVIIPLKIYYLIVLYLY